MEEDQGPGHVVDVRWRDLVHPVEPLPITESSGEVMEGGRVERLDRHRGESGWREWTEGMKEEKVGRED